MDVAQVLSELESVEALPVKCSGGRAWKLTGDDPKQVLLRKVLNEAERMCLEYDEDPLEDRLRGKWQEIAKGIWSLPENAAAYHRELSDWLGYGNWVLYQSPRREAWRMGAYTGPDKVLMKMREGGVWLCIYSFHDDDPWFVFTTEGPGSPP